MIDSNRILRRRKTNYSKITEEFRNRILKVAENGGDWKLIAEASELTLK